MFVFSVFADVISVQQCVSDVTSVVCALSAGDDDVSSSDVGHAQAQESWQ